MIGEPSIMTGMGWPSIVLMLLLWGGAITLVLWGCSGLFPARWETTEADAMAILRVRYARGEVLGHSSVKVTQDIYAHAFPKTRREAVAGLSRLLQRTGGA